MTTLPKPAFAERRERYHPRLSGGTRRRSRLRQRKSPARFRAGPFASTAQALLRGCALSTRVLDDIRIRQVGEQRRLRAEDGGQRVMGADLVAPLARLRRHAADADGAEELAVDDD